MAYPYVPPDIKNFNENYAIHLHGNDELGNKIDITAAMPENFSFVTQAHYEPLLPGSVLAALGSYAANSSDGAAIGNGITRLTGYSTVNKKLTQLIWTASEPIAIRIPFQFNVISDAKKDVKNQILALMKLTLPSDADGGLLRGPGRSFLRNQNFSPASLLSGNASVTEGSVYQLYLNIGKFVTFSNVVVLSVDTHAESMFDVNGNPMSVTVDVTFQTGTVISKSDLDNIFNNQEDSTSANAGTLSGFFNDLTKGVTSGGSAVVDGIKKGIGAAGRALFPPAH